MQFIGEYATHTPFFLRLAFARMMTYEISTATGRRTSNISLITNFSLKPHAKPS